MDKTNYMNIVLQTGLSENERMWSRFLKGQPPVQAIPVQISIALKETAPCAEGEPLGTLSSTQ